MDPTTIQELKARLEQEHDRLVAELKSIATPNPKIRGDWDASYPKFEPEEYGSHAAREEEADEVEEYEMRLAAEHSLESRLIQITGALERIRRGTHGSCKKCGHEIPHERLVANPAAEFCVEHSPISNDT